MVLQRSHFINRHLHRRDLHINSHPHIIENIESFFVGYYKSLAELNTPYRDRSLVPSRTLPDLSHACTWKQKTSNNVNKGKSCLIIFICLNCFNKSSLFSSCATWQRGMKMWTKGTSRSPLFIKEVRVLSTRTLKRLDARYFKCVSAHYLD